MTVCASFKKRSSFFGAALFLRPTDPTERTRSLEYPLEKIAALARANPELWEALLMKRNYLDFAWDHIGGNNEIDEFPAQTLVREVWEETGWGVERFIEVCRQWKEGSLKGFLYLVKPNEIKFMHDAPPRILCDEVQTVQYFPLLHILESNNFTAPVKGRIHAFIEGKPDFNIL